MPTFLLKTEPSDYAFADLVRDRACLWTGVSNPGALIHLRSVLAGDEILVYHTGDERAVVGLARATADPVQDPDRPGLTPDGLPKFAAVALAPVRACPTPVRLDAIKADCRFKDFALVRQGRLSVMPVPAIIDAALRLLAGLPPTAPVTRSGRASGRM